ncbi:hypothetical protein M9Y10_041563 [Tritrichomonas musculus]|uniref:SGF29 C-terminal domain-containing protein n=1 Tax=Tritrichomonas musculus TaxID=1915356 RepID=A0ABR2K4Q0_9EUKA
MEKNYDANLESSQIFSDLLKGAYKLEQYREKVSQISDVKDEESLKTLSKLVESSTDVLRFQKSQIKCVIDHLVSIIEERSLNNPIDNIVIPTREELKKKFAEFIELKLPQVTGPYPPLCGALRWPPDKIVPNNSYVCVPYGDQYILAIILCFDPETYSYKVTDAEPDTAVDSDVEIFDVSADKVIPLPTSLPVRRNKRVTFPHKAKVLALWKDEIGWTSVFYPAVVIGQPNNNSNYNLKFDGDYPITAVIPERFVVEAPSD